MPTVNKYPRTDGQQMSSYKQATSLVQTGNKYPRTYQRPTSIFLPTGNKCACTDWHIVSLLPTDTMSSHRREASVSVPTSNEYPRTDGQQMYSCRRAKCVLASDRHNVLAPTGSTCPRASVVMEPKHNALRNQIRNTRVGSRLPYIEKRGRG